MVKTEFRVRKGQLAQKVRKGQKAKMVPQAQQVLLDHKVPLAKTVKTVLPEQQD
jgi:hypothetical protein